MKNKYDVVIIGGGASGFFCAINIALKFPNCSIAILEQSKKVLEKVKISGGGRCNVTNSIYDAKEMLKYYPRGGNPLLYALHSFGCRDTMNWFKEHGVGLKIEQDGRVFPISNSSQSIISCFQRLAQQHAITVHTETKVTTIGINDYGYSITTLNEFFYSNYLVVASGCNSMLLQTIGKLGIPIVPPFPSLFSFNANDTLLQGLQGIVLADATISLHKKQKESGSILITHNGISGPAVLRLSAFAAQELFDLNYRFTCSVNWINNDEQYVYKLLNNFKQTHSRKKITNANPFVVPQRFWEHLLLVANIDMYKNWADISKIEINAIVCNTCNYVLQINGKCTNKDEFVTAGGVALNAIHTNSFESKQYKNLFFTGELLNIDGVTGGFNFQAAWASAYLVSQAIVVKLSNN